VGKFCISVEAQEYRQKWILLRLNLTRFRPQTTAETDS
jgi:hypothetical protein